MLMLTSTHKAAMAEARADDQAALSEYAADLKRANEARDNWRDSSKEWEAKFKKAVADLEGEVRDRKRVQYDLASARLENEALRPDAEQMRRKRAGDRNRVRKPRDKRAKNRGGGK